jgi:hypothetical protein
MLCMYLIVVDMMGDLTMLKECCDGTARIDGDR